MIVSAGQKTPKTGFYTCVSCGDEMHMHKGNIVPRCPRRECDGDWRVL